MSWTPAKTCVLCLATFALLAWPAAAQAQQRCDERGLDAFDAARRARRVIQDYAALHSVLQRDLDALSAGRAIFGMKPLKRRYFASPIVERSRWSDLPTCYEGQQRSSGLIGLRYGVIGGAELNDLNLRLDGFLINSSDTLDITLPGRDGGEPTERTLAQSQWMIGGRAQVTRWAALTLGVISDDRSPDPNEPDAASSRLYLALGVPALNLQAELILDQRDQSLQTLYIDLNRLRLTDEGLAMTARAGYLEDEAQVFTTLGVSIPMGVLHQPHPEPERDHDREVAPSIVNVSSTLYPEVSVEWDSPRLRHARLRGDLTYALFSDRRTVMLEVEGEPIDPIGVHYVDMGLFWEATMFQSRALERRVGEHRAWGWGSGARLISGFNFASFVLDTSFHLNRPETISQISELVGAGEWRLLVSLRVGNL